MKKIGFHFITYKLRGYFLTGLCLLVLDVSGNAQEYIPFGPATQGEVTNPIKKTRMSLLGVVNSSAFPVCSPVPTSVAGSYRYFQRLLTTNEAISLGIPIANVSGSGTKMVVVQDYAQAKECESTDGKFTVLYGNTIRTVITISDWDLKIGSSFPIIAADVTLNHKDDQLNIFVLGMANAKIPPLIAAIAGKPFDVSNYSDYLAIEKGLIGLTVDATTTLSIERLGALPNTDDLFLKSGSASSFALQQIRDGKTCDQAKAAFKDGGDPAAAAIIKTYESVAGGCPTPAPLTQTQKDKADQLLFKLKVKY